MLLVRINRQPDTLEIEVIEVPEVLVFSVKKEIQDFSQELPQLIHNSVVELTKMGGKPAGTLIVLYYLENVDFKLPLGKILTEVAWPVDNAQYSNNQFPKIKAARIMFKGPYQGMNAVYQSIHSWLVQIIIKLFILLEKSIIMILLRHQLRSYLPKFLYP